MKPRILISVLALAIAVFLVAGCSTKVVEQAGTVEKVMLPDDFSEMVGSPSPCSAGGDFYILLTYVTKEGKCKTRVYHVELLPAEIIWVKPESRE